MYKLAVFSRTVILALACAGVFPCVCAAEAEDSREWYVSAAGAWFMPGNGVAADPCAGAALRFGVYPFDSLAFECDFGYCPNLVRDAGGNTPLYAVSARGLWHVFGYERFDPFLTLGATALFAESDVFADGSRETGIGPEFGCGAFYHLTNNWSLRFDLRAATLLDSTCSMAYATTFGLQYAFGGDAE